MFVLYDHSKIKTISKLKKWRRIGLEACGKTEYRYYCSYYFFRFTSNPLYEYHFLINHFQVAPWMLWRGQHADKAVGQSVPHCHRRTSCWWCPNFILMSLWRACARYNEAVLQTEAAISVITAHQLFRMTSPMIHLRFVLAYLHITRLVIVF